MNSANIFLKTLFFGTPLVAASVKTHNYTKIKLCCKNFLKVHTNTGKNMFPKYLSEDDCFIKTIMLLTVMITTILSVS